MTTQRWSDIFDRPRKTWWERSWYSRWYGIRMSFWSLYYQTRAIFLPYNRVKLTTLPRTWTDACNRLPHAVFTVFEGFVRDEMGGIEGLRKRIAEAEEELQHVPDSMDMHPEYWKDEVSDLQDMILIYNYWLNRKILKIIEPEDGLEYKSKREFSSEEEFSKYLRGHWEAERAAYAQEEEMLIKVIKMRRRLWT